MMRSIASSDCSNTLRLWENGLQLLGGGFHPHLQRRDPRAGELRHLFVLQVLVVLEEERLSVFRPEPRERPPDGVVPLGALRRTRERHTAERRVVAHEQPRAPRRAPAGRAAPVDQDAVEPRTEPLRIVAARERAVCPDEGVLQRLLRVLPVPEHVHGVAPQAVAVPRDQRRVRPGVASHNVYVVSIDASSGLDTSGGSDWVRVATPERTFELLTLQHGTTAFLGEAELDPLQYRAIRMVIDADKSSIAYHNGAPPPVHWPWPGSGAITMYALVAEPLDLSTPAIAASGGAGDGVGFHVGRGFLD